MAYNMDRKTFFKVFAVLLANTGITLAFAANLNVENNASLKISEGPYLLSMDGGKVCVVFMTNKRAVASVEVFSPTTRTFHKTKFFRFFANRQKTYWNASCRVVGESCSREYLLLQNRGKRGLGVLGNI
ncbi:MAG: hypothetical protein ACLUKN_06390 [Bacilli bacterium]